MSGIAGFVSTSLNCDHAEHVLRLMLRELATPHDECPGVWVDHLSTVAVGGIGRQTTGRLLAQSTCGRYVLVFDGHIYNVHDFALALDIAESPNVCELFLACIARWGITDTLRRVNGSFAFALLDVKDRVLRLGRDRIGEKPLYFGLLGNSFMFSSRIGGLRPHPDFVPQVDRDVVALYLHYNYVPTPYSIYKNIYKVRPGSLVTVDFGEQTLQVHHEDYWSIQSVADAGRLNMLSCTAEDAVSSLESLLRSAIKSRMLEGLPTGAFLSGGVDSSLVVAIMQSLSSKPIQTFTIGFTEQDYNEADHASAVASHLGTSHTVAYISPDQARAVISKLPEMYDEPFGDSSQIPTYLVSSLAGHQVSAALVGDGGDELFGGYNRYVWGSRLWRRLGWIPTSVRRILSKGLTSVPLHSWQRFFSTVGPLIPKRYQASNPTARVYKLARAIASSSLVDMYHVMTTFWPRAIVLGCEQQLPTLLEDPLSWPRDIDILELMMYLDQETYLPDDGLTKVSRAAWSTGVTVHAPFLDHRVVEFSWRLPLSMKIRDGVGKWLLRQLLYRYVPSDLVDRPKTGFGIPLAEWLRGPLRDWAGDLLDPDRIRRQALLDPMPISSAWQDHLHGRGNWEHHLWGVLMLQSWIDAAKPRL